MRLGRDSLPQRTGDGDRRPAWRGALRGIVERMVRRGIATGGDRRGCLRFLLCWGEGERGGMGVRPTLRPLKDHEVSGLPEVEKAQQHEWAPLLAAHSEAALRQN